MLDSRLIKPPVLDIISKSKKFNQKYQMDAFNILIPEK